MAILFINIENDNINSSALKIIKLQRIFKNSFVVIYGSDNINQTKLESLQLQLLPGNTRIIRVLNSASAWSAALNCYDAFKDADRLKQQSQYFTSIEENLSSVKTTRKVLFACLVDRLQIPCDEAELVIEATCTIQNLINCTSEDLSAICPIDNESVDRIVKYFRAK